MERRTGWLVIFIFSLVGLFGGVTHILVRSTQFDWYCVAYLERAASASNAQIALRNLDRAIEHLDRQGMTHGHTSLAWDVPSDDVGAWYRNLVAARVELARVPSGATQLEESNVLIRVREVLTEGGAVSYPENISLVPHPLVRLLLLAGSLVLALISAFMKWLR